MAAKNDKHNARTDDQELHFNSLMKNMAGENPTLPLIARISFAGMRAFFWGGIVFFGLLGCLINVIS